MDKTTLRDVEATSCCNCNKYTHHDEDGNLVEQWEKDANGEWKNVTDDRLREIEMAALRKEMSKIAKQLGLTEEQLIAILEERGEEQCIK